MGILQPDVDGLKRPAQQHIERPCFEGVVVGDKAKGNAEHCGLDGGVIAKDQLDGAAGDQSEVVTVHVNSSYRLRMTGIQRS